MEFGLLGPLEARRGGRPVDIGGPRQRAVLAALLSRANQVATLAYLLESVWERPPTAPESNIRSYISGLRRRLRIHGDVGRIVSHGGGYLLRVRPEELDSQVFEVLIRRAEATVRAGCTAEAVDILGEALALWRGRPLEGLDVGQRLRAEVARLEDRRLYAAERYAQAAATARRHEDVVAVMRELTAEYPLHEGLWAELMSALASSGRRIEAMDAYRRVRAQLAEELGLEPGPRLQRLHEQALAADPARRRR